MPATLFPLPCDYDDLTGHLTGLDALLDALEEETGRDRDFYYDRSIRSALVELEDRSGVLFFSTRFATRELASQSNLVLGTDFDRYVQPFDYDLRAWDSGTGRIDLPHVYLNSVTTFRISTAGGGVLYDIPSSWWNRDDERGTIHSLPNAGGTGVILSGLQTLMPMLRGSAAQTSQVPLLVHLRYTAGLVDAGTPPFASYTPEMADQHTDWAPNLVRQYQQMIGQYAAGDVMDNLTNAADNGGVQVAFDGLSQTVNPEVLMKRALGKKKEAGEWADKLKESKRGVAIVFA